MVVTVECPRCCVCGKRGMVHVRRDDLLLFKAGVPVQDAFPDLDVDQRELLLSGTHAHCWAAIYGEGDDEMVG